MDSEKTISELHSKGELSFMQSATKFIGLDVSKEKISVAIADAGRDLPRYYGSIPHTAAALRKLIKESTPQNTANSSDPWILAKFEQRPTCLVQVEHLIESGIRVGNHRSKLEQRELDAVLLEPLLVVEDRSSTR